MSMSKRHGKEPGMTLNAADWDGRLNV